MVLKQSIRVMRDDLHLIADALDIIDPDTEGGKEAAERLATWFKAAAECLGDHNFSLELFWNE